jgi:toxin CcdB
MARFDVYENPTGSGYLLDVQSDLLSGINTRVVVPLLPLKSAPKPASRLNPVFDIRKTRVAMVTQFMAAVPGSELTTPVASLSTEAHRIVDALDMLFFGF